MPGFADVRQAAIRGDAEGDGPPEEIEVTGGSLSLGLKLSPAFSIRRQGLSARIDPFHKMINPPLEHPQVGDPQLTMHLNTGLPEKFVPKLC